MAAAANSTSVIMEVCYFEIVIFSFHGYNNLTHIFNSCAYPEIFVGGGPTLTTLFLS